MRQTLILSRKEGELVRTNKKAIKCTDWLLGSGANLG